MIHNDEELQLARDQLSRAEAALSSIQCDVRPVSESRYLLMAESYLEMIQKLQADINEYLELVAHETQPH